ncbi:hypothetical protein GGU11DRAFT_52169 [Lentinula aff. detonsa]|nr:hypothetical protein GGU11DRAFT_52169 [Lentinula aff. detonsa]
MASRVFADDNDTYSYQVPLTQCQETSFSMRTTHNPNIVDEHTVTEYYYGPRDYTWSDSEGSECQEIAYPLDGNMSSDYRPPYDQECGYSHHHPKPDISAVRSSLLPIASTSYSPYTPQIEITSSPTFTSSLIGHSPYYDEYESLSYPREGEEESDMMFTNGTLHDGVYYNTNEFAGGVWVPETCQNFAFVQPNTCAEDFGTASASISEELGSWTKEMQYAHTQQTTDEALLQEWFKDLNPQDPSAYYPSYPAGIGYSYSTHLSTDTSNTPSDFTSESPLSPLEFETCHSDLSSTISPDTHLAPLLPPFTSSSVLPAQTLLPIIHAPRPTRSIDSSYLKRLIAASEIPKD